MYTQQAFREGDPVILAAIIRATRLPILISVGPSDIEATHMPLTYEPEPAPHGRLVGHLARANPQWRSLRAGADAMAIFHAHDFYVSPNWYASKQGKPAGSCRPGTTKPYTLTARSKSSTIAPPSTRSSAH